jgi:DNA-directed RNA polymerase sigma subunit (sigma70/sigma32)
MISYPNRDAWRSWIKPSSPDAVKRYIDEIAPAERLSATDLAEVVAAVALGDEAAKTRLLHAHLQFVVFIAGDYADRNVDLFDLIQEGNMGLIRAVDELGSLPADVAVIDYLNARIRATIEEWLELDQSS